MARVANNNPPDSVTLTYTLLLLTRPSTGGSIQDYGKEGHKAIEYAGSNACAAARGVWGHAPQEIFGVLRSILVRFWALFQGKVVEGTRTNLYLSDRK